MDDHDIERELFFAMVEETDGLGAPELDLERVRHRAGRRRAGLSAAGSAVVLAAGVGVAFSLGTNHGTGSGNAVAAAVAMSTSAQTVSQGDGYYACVIAAPGHNSSTPPTVLMIGPGGKPTGKETVLFSPPYTFVPPATSSHPGVPAVCKVDTGVVTVMPAPSNPGGITAPPKGK